MLVPRLRFKEFKEEWKKISLINVFTFYNTNSLSRADLSDEGLIKNIHYGDIHQKFNNILDVNKEKLPYIKSEINMRNEENYCQDGDLIFADASEDYEGIGKAVEVINVGNNKIASGLHTILARDTKKVMSLGFKGYLFNTSLIHNQIRVLANGFKVYGISKNKKGKEISDFEKYKPWSGEEFSGKLEYELDNNEKYEIYRDFNKKNPKIFNENMEDISKQFNIDKNKGNEFFYEQTKIDEDLFLSTLAINQSEVKLEGQAQNFLIQKIANLAQTGDDSISFKRVIDRINRRQLDEVGTERSREKPINVVARNLQELCQEKENLEKVLDKFFQEDYNKAGSGLGLAISNEIVKLHKGKLILESQKGEGTCITFTLKNNLMDAIAEEKM